MRKKDFIVIAGILLIALIAFLFLELSKEEGSSVVVRVNGEVVATYSLEKNAQYTLNNGTNILCIEDGKAYLVDANCPDHLCVKQGAITYNGETITCLPNKLTVTIINDKEPSVDLVS